MAASLLRTIYDLDTLDTRFTTPSSVPYRPAAASCPDPGADPHTGEKDDVERSRIQQLVRSRAGPSLWRTPEFFLYYVALAIVLPSMIWIAYDVSSPSDPRYARFSHLLQTGWIPGRQIDISDAQYQIFRSNLPYMVMLLFLHPLCRRLYEAFISPASKTAAADTQQQGSSRFDRRVSFDFAFALFYLAILHGFSALKVLLILAINYQVATALPRRYVPAVTWTFNIGILFSNELCEGYRFADVAGLFMPHSSSDHLLGNVGQWLDSYGGLLPRWEIMFNITVLRLISFNMDYYWSLGRSHAASIDKQLDPANLSERDRVRISAPPDAFSLRTYVAYAAYAPLYVAGPILTFNDYVAQIRFRPASVEVRRTVLYGVRFVLALLAMELTLHFIYVSAISLAQPIWSEYTAVQLSLMSYFNLHLIWLKLLLPWRLFRLWALIDGIDPPENLLRCMSNNYSTMAFWRSWHRSYNRWLVRYLFVPLGGASFSSAFAAARSVASYVIVFTFVALWHDIKLRLLVWGWLVVIFMLPEISANALFPARVRSRHPTLYRILGCAGAVLNVLMMMAANLVGFAVGLDGLRSIISGIFRDWSGLSFLVVSCLSLFMGIQFMFEIRQTELRRGISLKC